MHHSAISQIDGYWHGLYGSGRIPKRRDVNPIGIENALDCTFLLERVAPGIAKIRLAGGKLNDLMGMEVRGMPLTALIAPHAREIISNAVDTVCTGPKIARLSLSSGPGAGRGELNARMFMAPLEDDRGRVSRVLGCLQYQGDLGFSPRRFDTVSCEFAHLNLGTETPVDLETIPKRAFAEAPRHYKAAPVARPKAPKLQLVYSAD